MSLKTTKIHLIQLLEDSSNKVIALSGKWGTGKSHLWDEVKEASDDPGVKSALYVSLFGLGSMDQVKLKIIQSAIPDTAENTARWDQLKRSWSAATKVLESVHKGFSALNDIALLAVPSMLKNKVIVLDDIERKHPNLSVDEVMGFIDEYTQQHGARIILILNSDQLADRLIWEKLREKVIDQELRLDTTPLEAFDIATQLAPSTYSKHIGKSIDAWGITNIRIICKIIRAVNRILSDRTDLSDAVLERVIPSTVLLTAIHYKGIDDGPDLNFVLNFGTSGSWDGFDKSEKEEDEQIKMKARWRLKLLDIGIYSCDEYERLVADFLNSGMFDVTNVSKIIERYSSEADVLNTQELARKIHEHIVWHHKMPVQEIFVEANALAEKAHLLDPYNVTSLHELLSTLEGGSDVAELILDNWIKDFSFKGDKESVFDNFFRRPLHPKIKAEFEKVKSTNLNNGNIVEIVNGIMQNSTWGAKEKNIMNSVTAQQIEETIKSLDIEKLRIFMSQFVELSLKRSFYESFFGNGIDQFLQACRTIYADKSNPRLSNLMKILFKDSNLELEQSV